MKKKKAVKAVKKAAKKAVAKQPAAKKAPAPKKAAPTTPSPAIQPSGSSRGGGAERATYTPPPVQGTGWAPFRYPPQ
ncbi:MAG: hypothetical protein HYU42_09410 [Candidatus Rokubacteria bacterium]|nr:hypothetical protein [Candidatus Rokubacteria bacterium]MBI3106796.1 hypothetical protein [Candidatus Rokubacteria bacterium]